MPSFAHGDVDLYYEIRGRGKPVLLVAGLASDNAFWLPVVDAFAAHRQVIVVDNRGSGRTTPMDTATGIGAMADDCAALVRHLRLAGVDLVGHSMGGMIAQEFALQYPKRVRSLILGCTAAGGPHAVRAEPAALQALTRQGMTPEESMEAIIPFIYDAATPRERIDEDMAIRMKWYPTPQGYAGQLQGIFAWEAYSRITRIAAPTLVIHGESDRLIPPANARLITARIPGAKLALIPRASHIFDSDQPDTARHAILEFLSAQHGRAPRSQA